MNPPKHPREAIVLATIFLFNAIEFLQGGMLTFAAGPIIGEIGASPEEYTLATIVYAVVAIAAISKQRWLIERLGWRSFVLASVGVFVIGAAICGSSSSFPQFLLGRIVMALGGGPFLTNARVMVHLLPPSPRRFRGILAYAGALTVGNGSAPFLASLAVSQDRWPGIFVLLATLAVIGAVLGTLVLPTDITPKEKRSHAHPWLTLLMMGGAFLSLYALLRAGYDFYSDALPLIVAVLMGVGSLLYFGRHQYHHERPLLVLKRLMIPRYMAGIATFTLGYMILGANNYMLPVFMQGGLGFPWEIVGKVQSAGLLVATPTFTIMAIVLKNKPAAKKFYVTGFAFLALSGLMLARLNGNADLWTDVWPGIALFGAFITPVMVTTALHTFMDIMGDDAAFHNGQQIKNMLSQFGVSMGVALATLGLQWRTSEHLSVLVERFNAGGIVFGGATERLSAQFAASHGAQAAQVALGTLAQQVSQQATLLASLDYFSFLVVLGVSGAALMVAQRILK